MQINETTELQLRDFAEKMRHALACDVAIVVCVGASEQYPGHTATQTGISCKTAKEADEIHVVLRMLKVTDAMLRRISNNQMWILVDGADGELQSLGEVIQDRFSVRTKKEHG